MNKLLKFLFADSQVECDAESILEELKDIEDLKVAAKPLISILKSIGMDTDKESISYGEEGVALEFDTNSDYVSALQTLSDPDSVNKLAESGWVAAPGGESDTCLRIFFLQINPATGDGTENSHEEVDLDKLLGTARKAEEKKTDSVSDLKEAHAVVAKALGYE